MNPICQHPAEAQSWYDLAHIPPKSPFDLVAMASITGGFGTQIGIYADSTQYSTPPASWLATPHLSLTAPPAVAALGTDQQQNVANAQQWGFEHKTANLSTLLPPPLRDDIYLLGGCEWANTIPLTLGGSTITSIELSFLDNATGRGDAQGTIPVIRWETGTYTGAISLIVTLKECGDFRIGIRTISNAGDWAMYQGFWHIV
ncbi:MAG: hypothetical protein IT211_09860 [Armatimonadetes bacterium]|nr:hypothetical protein [Armatimonadota bacterium]